MLIVSKLYSNFLIKVLYRKYIQKKNKNIILKIKKRGNINIMFLSEKQIEMYNNCIFLNEGLFSKKQKSYTDVELVDLFAAEIAMYNFGWVCYDKGVKDAMNILTERYTNKGYKCKVCKSNKAAALVVQKGNDNDFENIDFKFFVKRSKPDSDGKRDVIMTYTKAELIKRFNK